MGKLKTILAGFGVSALASGAFAAGYQIIEQGASNMGTAMAGAVVNANNDASAAFWNPSAASFMGLDVGKTRVDSVLSIVVPTLCVNNRGSTPAIPGTDNHGTCGTNELVPNFYVAHRLSEDFTVTLSVTAPYGLESKYNTNWFGKYQAERSYLYTTDVNPSIAYQITDWLSIGAGISGQFAYCSLSQYTPYGMMDLTGESWGVGGNAGFTIKYAEDGRFGFSWRSSVYHDLTGAQHFNDIKTASISADMYMPDTFTVGLYQRLRGCLSEFAVMVDYCFTRWSVFDELKVEGIGAPAIPENWKDTSRISFGIHYYPKEIEGLTLRVGGCYDESPVRSAQDRTARIPCSDRFWASCGAGYKYGPFTFDIAYSYIFVLDSSMDRYEASVGSTLRGDYYAHIHVISGQIGFEF